MDISNQHKSMKNKPCNTPQTDGSPSAVLKVTPPKKKKTKINKKKYKKKFCLNCGRYGHMYSFCHEPIISAGIILHRYNPTKRTQEFLHVCRKDSIGYVDFVRGKYRLGDINYIQRLIDMMTIQEHIKIQSYTFADLWRDIWCITTDDIKVDRHKYEYDKSQKRLTILKKGYILKYHKTYVCLADLLKNCTTLFKSAEWGLPKGRRMHHETDLECACREFTEETQIPRSDLTLLNNRPIICVFQGQNNRTYKHIFFVATYTGKLKTISLNYDNMFQLSEIGDIQWFTIKEAINKFRPYNQLKVRNLLIANKIIPKYSKKNVFQK